MNVRTQEVRSADEALRRALPAAARLVETGPAGAGERTFRVLNVSASEVRSALSDFMVQESWCSPGWLRVGIARGTGADTEMVQLLTELEDR